MRRTKFPRNPEKLFGEESRKRAYVTLCPFSRSPLSFFSRISRSLSKCFLSKCIVSQSFLYSLSLSYVSSTTLFKKIEVFSESFPQDLLCLLTRTITLLLCLLEDLCFYHYHSCFSSLLLVPMCI
uniref:Uncharacterized protein n=1 Tax=Cacopsylla melanoneura TaxID=428564 RepID=A0A8D8UBH7_9HEMI